MFPTWRHLSELDEYAAVAHRDALLYGQCPIWCGSMNVARKASRTC